MTGEDGTFGYDVTDPLNPVAAVPLGPVDREHRRRAAGAGRLRAARLPAPQHAADVARRWTTPAQVTKRRDARHRQRARDHRGGLREADVRGAGLGADVADHRDERNPDGTVKLELLDMWTTELNELANQTGRSPATGNCSAHWFDEQRRADRAGLVRPGRAVPRRHQPARHQAGRATTRPRGRSGRRTSRRATRETVYALDTTSGIDVLHVDRSAAMRARKMPVTTADLLRGTRNADAQLTLGLRLPAPDLVPAAASSPPP